MGVPAHLRLDLRFDRLRHPQRREGLDVEPPVRRSSFSAASERRADSAAARVIRAQHAAERRHPAEAVAFLEYSVALDATLELWPYAQGVGQSGLEPARHARGVHAVVEQLAGPPQ